MNAPKPEMAEILQSSCQFSFLNTPSTGKISGPAKYRLTEQWRSEPVRNQTRPLFFELPIRLSAISFQTFMY
jgi:hypothetical protein